MKSNCSYCGKECHGIWMMCENNPSWEGGITAEPYCSIWVNKEFKKMIKERDGYACKNFDCKTIKPKRLVIHHIDYNKKNCIPKNLITLCISCNSKANFKKEEHKNFYQNIIKEIYEQ